MTQMSFENGKVANLTASRSQRQVDFAIRAGDDEIEYFGTVTVNGGIEWGTNPAFMLHLDNLDDLEALANMFQDIKSTACDMMPEANY